MYYDPIDTKQINTLPRKESFYRVVTEKRHGKKFTGFEHSNEACSFKFYMSFPIAQRCAKAWNTKSNKCL